MSRSSQQKTICFFVAIVLGSLSANGAEIRLKAKAVCRGDIVLLGDVAEIVDNDQRMVAKLSETWMFPAPIDFRTVNVDEIRTVLNLHSVDLKLYRITGADSVRIEKAEGEAPTSAAIIESTSKSTLVRAKDLIEAEITRYLQSKISGEGELQVTAEFATLEANAIVANANQLIVSGGQRPWFGPQQFHVECPTATGTKRISVSAVVAQPETAVYFTQSLQRGEVVQARHVELRPVPPNARISDLVYRTEEVIGKEATRSTRADEPVGKNNVQAQILVRRNEQVTVTAIAPGVTIRSFAYADKDGAKGDLIAVWTLDRRKRFLARVVDYQRVEVYANGSRTNN